MNCEIARPVEMEDLGWMAMDLAVVAMKAAIVEEETKKRVASKKPLGF